jgi:two-component system sensor histidine kinase VanS
LNRSTYHQRLTRLIILRFFIAIFVYSFVLIVSFVAASYFLSSFIWHANDFLYPLFSLINHNRTVFIIMCWLVGAVIIFIYYWRKTLSYTDTIVRSTEILVRQDDELVHLPPELKEVEDKLNNLKMDAVRNARLAKESEQRKNDLIVYLAHDLKTPLTSVIGYLSLLRDEKEISQELRTKYLSISLDKAQRLEDLINEFFDITRFNLSHMSLEISRVNLSRMLEQIIYEFLPLFAEKNLQCHLSIAPNFEIRCDVQKMERVFDNLIRNAVNYSFENSEINILVEMIDGHVSIRIVNSGNTIPKESLERIFEQFFRLDTSRATKTGGAGLGLAIAKEIVELHHGTIRARSENEKVEFTVLFPVL